MPAETGPAVVPVAEEVLQIETHDKETGRVRVSLHTETVQDVVEERLRSHHATVERVAIGREVTEVPQTREEDGVLIIPVVEEILVIERRLVLKEELHLRQTVSEQTLRQPAERRVQHAVIERLPADQARPISTPSTETP